MSEERDKDIGTIKRMEKILMDELRKTRKSNNLSILIGAIICVIIFGYLSWIGKRVSSILDPVKAAEAATGAALEAIPKVGAELRTTLTDLAPEIAGIVVDQALGAIPAYREKLTEQIGRAIDEASKVIAEASANAIAESIEKDKEFDKEETRIIVDALVKRYKTVLDEILDEPDNEGLSLRKRINQSLGPLASIDRQLRILAKTKRPPTEEMKMERDFLMTWMKLLIQYEEIRDKSIIDQEKAKE